jgi:hypothetical protein
MRITRENQGKGKKWGNIFEYRMEELSPMGRPLAGPLTMLLMVFLLGPCVINSSAGSFTIRWTLLDCNWWDNIKDCP